MNEQRRTLIVDRRFQFHLILEVLLISFIAINTVVIAMFLLLYGTVIPADAGLMLYGTVIPADAGLMLGVSIAAIEIIALVAILWLARRLSNRIAGPVYRMCRTLEEVAAGDLTARVRLREKDRFLEQAENINASLARLQDRIESIKGIARRLDADPSADLVHQLNEKLIEFKAEPPNGPETERSHSEPADDSRGTRISPGSRRNTQGFTLVELLMGLLVVSILILISLPLYLDYTVRAKVSEGLGIVDPVKRALTEYHLETGDFPIHHADAENAAGVRPPEHYRSTHVDSIHVLSDGVIEIRYGIPALGTRNRLFLEPRTGTPGAFSWGCDDDSADTLRMKYRPQVCRNS